MAATGQGPGAQDWRIVRLEPATAGLLDRLESDVFDGPIRPEALAAFLDDPRHLMMLADAGGRVVGMASATELLHPDKRPQLFVNEVGVAPGWQRRGIGRALVSALIEAARARGCDAAWLGTATDNERGRACFSSVPGATVGETFVLYEWALSHPEP